MLLQYFRHNFQLQIDIQKKAFYIGLLRILQLLIWFFRLLEKVHEHGYYST